MESRVAIVTGAGSGIGREAALLFAAEGARVIVADRDTGAGRRVVAEVVWVVVPALGLIMLVLGSIFFGVATPTEAAGVGALGALLLAACSSTERLDEPMPEKPSLLGPSFPAATLTMTPASVTSSSLRECMSVPSLPPSSCEVIPQESETMSIP